MLASFCQRVAWLSFTPKSVTVTDFFPLPYSGISFNSSPARRSARSFNAVQPRFSDVLQVVRTLNRSSCAILRGRFWAAGSNCGRTAANLTLPTV